MNVKIGQDVFEEVDEELRIAISYLLTLREKLGIGDEARLEGSKSNWKSTNKTIITYALEIYRVWGALYPYERLEFIDNTREELKYERPVQDSVKAGGYQPTSFPMRLEAMYSILIPGIKIQDKRFWKPMFSAIPELRRSNYA